VIPKKRTDERLGEMLLRQGIISEKQLEEALNIQDKDGGLLGENFIKLGYVSEREIAQAIVSQYGFPYMPLANYDINPEAVKLVPEEISRRYSVVPLDVIGDIIIVAMPNPLDKKCIDELEKITGKKVHIFLTVVSGVVEAINKIYKPKA